MGIKGLLDKLPSRPLTVEEGNDLASKESSRSWIRPESVILRGSDDVVVALMAVDRANDRAWLVGYDPEDESWLAVEGWAREDLDREDFYERLEAWEARTFGGRAEYQL